MYKTVSFNATVSLTNNGCGHAVPTGEPMRALVMLVEAEGDCGPLTATGGMTVNDIGGAYAQGFVDEHLSVNGTVVDWPAVGSIARVGDVIRVVRPTGVYDDYAGIGAFGDGRFSAKEKGLEIQTPVGEAVIVDTGGDTLTLSRSSPSKQATACTWATAGSPKTARKPPTGWAARIYLRSSACR